MYHFPSLFYDSIDRFYDLIDLFYLLIDLNNLFLYVNTSLFLSLNILLPPSNTPLPTAELSPPHLLPLSTISSPSPSSPYTPHAPSPPTACTPCSLSSTPFPTAQHSAACPQMQAVSSPLQPSGNFSFSCNNSHSLNKV
ncbi:MAG: hypothetical protein H6Q26_516 [Bacteroidetes bacterium]|nr:hypothetical protein [Bacteroidota bacterium]